MSKAYIGFGSNMGCKVGNIRRALLVLGQEKRIRFLEESSYYRTAPVGKIDQDWFVNLVARVETSLAPEELLKFCLETERKLGRVRKEKWGPRVIDIDLLVYEGCECADTNLELPHPRILERAFVLAPLLELEAEIEIGNAKGAKALEQINDQEVERMQPVVAVVGASKKPERYAYLAQSLLMEKGYRVCPVAPRGGSVLGVEVVTDLSHCTDPVDTVTLYVGSARVGKLTEAILEVMPRRVVFNPGTENEVLRNTLQEAGIETIEGCTLVMLKTQQW